MLIKKGGITREISQNRLAEYKGKGYAAVEVPLDTPETPKNPENQDATDTAEKFVCSVCGKEYATEKGLANHMTKEHTEV